MPQFGRWHAVELLEHSFGIETWTGRDETGRHVVIKATTRESLPSETARLEREAAVLHDLKSPEIAPLPDTGSVAGRVYLVTAYVDGESSPRVSIVQ